MNRNFATIFIPYGGRGSQLDMLVVLRTDIATFTSLTPPPSLVEPHMIILSQKAASISLGGSHSWFAYRKATPIRYSDAG